MDIEIEDIHKVESPIHYIKHYVCNVKFNEESKPYDFYIGFTMEYLPTGIPDITIKFIDEPNQIIKQNEGRIRKKISELEKTGVF